MEFKHEPVMLSQCIEGLNINPDGVYVDGTLGGGGHSSAICGMLSPAGTLIGTDADRDALEAAGQKLKDKKCRIHLVNSSYSQKELTSVISRYGEERWASRIAEFIVRSRKDKPIDSTGELVDIIKAAVPASARRTGPHPAKRTFQAIRIEVNDELGQLQRAVENFCDILSPGGRLCIITFHSLEDRIVKEIFSRRANPCTCPKEFPVCVCGKKADIKKITGKPIIPSEEEVSRNPRARSAKLRIAEKI